MSESTSKVVEFPSESSRDVLTEILRSGAQQLLTRAIEDEVASYLASRETLRDDCGRQQVVRNGHLPERHLQTPLGAMKVKQPRVRDRRPDGEREKFTSSILPPYLALLHHSG